MPMLPSRHYVSDHTRFIRDLIEKKPDLPAKQREGRAIWWDKTPGRPRRAAGNGRGPRADDPVRLPDGLTSRTSSRPPAVERGTSRLRGAHGCRG